MSTLSKKIRKIKRRILGTHRYQNSDFTQRHDLEHRWSLVAPHLPSEPSWFLDIGSNNGKTLKSLVAEGHYGLGLEVDEAAAAKDLPSNAAMMICEVNKDTLKGMPHFDGVFMLSVFHRIWALLGPDTAKAVLAAAGAKADMLVFEGCSRHARYESEGRFPLPEFKDLDEDDSVAWHTEMLSTLIAGSTVTFAGVTTTLRTNDPRPMFIVKKATS